jgi:hypothetical protein
MTTSGQSDIDRELSEVYDYVRREGQNTSPDCTVPKEKDHTTSKGGARKP